METGIQLGENIITHIFPDNCADGATVGYGVYVRTLSRVIIIYPWIFKKKSWGVDVTIWNFQMCAP